MDGASAGVTGWAASGISIRPASLLAVALAAKAAANAAALSAAAAFSAAGFSEGTLRILMLWEAQPPRKNTEKTRTADLISPHPASARPACRACPTPVAAHRCCRGGRRGHRRRFLCQEQFVATPVPACLI